MSDVAALIRDLVAAGTSPELIGRVADALAQREVVVMRDEQAERRREKDRQRKRAVCGIPQTSADSAESASIYKKDIKEEYIEGASADIRGIPQTRKKAAQLPSDWTLPADWKTWAIAEGCADPDREAAKFADHFRGNGTRKQDWHATWRNWVRKAADFAPAKRAAPRDSPPAEPAPNARLSDLRARANTLKTGSTFARDAAQRYPRQDLEEMIAHKFLTVADLQRIGIQIAPRAVG